MPTNPLGEHPMATLTVRDLDPRLKERLCARAARNDHSMRAELRHLLGEALARDEQQEPSLVEAIRRRFEPLGGVELEPPSPDAGRRAAPLRPVIVVDTNVLSELALMRPSLAVAGPAGPSRCSTP